MLLHSLKASRMSLSLSLGRAREAANLCRHTRAALAYLGLRVPQAIRKGSTKYGRRLKSHSLSVMAR